MSDEIRVVAVVQAKPGQESAVAAVLRACVAPSRAEPGCRFYTPHADMAASGRFVFVERWADRAALAEHARTAHFQAMAAALAPITEGDIQVSVLSELA